MNLAFFGQYLLSEGIINARQLTDAVDLQEAANLEVGQIAIQGGLLDEDQVKEIVRLQLNLDIYFGEAAERLGYLTKHDVSNLLREQKEKHIYFGDALVKLNYLTEEEKGNALENYVREQETNVLAEKENFPEVLEPQKEFIEEFVSFTMKMLKRMGGILTKYEDCQVCEDEVPLPPVSVQVGFSGDFSKRISRYGIMGSKDVANIVATKIYKKTGLSVHLIFQEYDLIIDNEVVTDVIAELVNIICGQVSTKLTKGEEFIGGIPEKTVLNPENAKFPLGENERAALITLSTHFGQIQIFLVFPLRALFE